MSKFHGLRDQLLMKIWSLGTVLDPKTRPGEPLGCHVVPLGAQGEPKVVQGRKKSENRCPLGVDVSIIFK